MPLLPIRRAQAARTLLATVSLAAVLPILGGCQTREEVTGSIYPADYRDRHPIVLADSSRVIDVFPEGPSGLSARSRRDLADYLGEYRKSGSGPLMIQVPKGAGTNPNTSRALQLIQGATGGRGSVSSYQPTDPMAASPIRLTFRRLQAKVSGKCGLWPDDLGVSDARSSWQNQEYWNYGCAYQSNLASQVDDPNDLVRGRHETPPDVGRRMFNFGQIRQGNDPSTQWKQQGTTVQSGVTQ